MSAMEQLSRSGDSSLIDLAGLKKAPMAILTRKRSMQKRATAIFSRPPKLLVKVGQILAAGWVSISYKLCFAKTGADEVQDDSCT